VCLDTIRPLLLADSRVEAAHMAFGHQCLELGHAGMPTTTSSAFSNGTCTIEIGASLDDPVLDVLDGALVIVAITALGLLV
jgi:hypothetical protein